MLSKRVKIIPSAVGAGLVALDIIVDENKKTAFAAGGTCANVMIGLSYLGWKSRVVSRLGVDYASEIVLDDLKTFGVNTSFAQIEPRARTPVIVQRMRKDSDGRPYHTFSFSCPSCGRRLPSYQAVPAKCAGREDRRNFGGSYSGILRLIIARHDKSCLAHSGKGRHRRL